MSGIYIKTREFIPVTKYKCEHCSSIYENEVVTCSNCGGTDFELIEETSKYRYIYINEKELRSKFKSKKAERLDKNINYTDKVISEFGKCFLIVFCLFLFLGMPCIVLNLMEKNMPGNILHYSSFTGDFFFVLGFIIGIIIDILIGFGIYKLSKRKKLNISKANTNFSKKNRNLKEYILIVGLKYDIVRQLGLKERYVVRVKYYSSNGVCFTLNSNKTFSKFPSSTVDLIINPDDINDYYIDFNLESIFYYY